jgi:N-acetylglucosamine-6-phosphate deacetylase
VAEGVVRLSRDDAIAGSGMTMDGALRRAVRAGLSIVDVCRMASTTPGATIGVGTEDGALRADLVELSEDLQVVRVMCGGEWL